jgi:hypothetical protein
LSADSAAFLWDPIFPDRRFPAKSLKHPASTFDAKQLAYFLLNPHPKMPDLPLSRAAADDIAAYIATLK